MEYDFRKLEPAWQETWINDRIYQVSNISDKPKCYVLDMFPYPSGAGLHVGHPLGYIASDIYSRYKRLKGFNVLHPMGFDSFGLPAEQYAIETGQHPANTTRVNIANFKKQLAKIGFCYDWSREVQTSDPAYYRWTQWIFLQLFQSWYNPRSQKAEPIETLEAQLAASGTSGFKRLPQDQQPLDAAGWKKLSAAQQQEFLMHYRLAFSAYGEVNWCEALGTVLANDEVVNGVSERGGHPVVRKKMRQWYLRITEYADRLLEGLERVEFSEAMKEMQRNWIGRSEGAELDFSIDGHAEKIRVYTTRPDTIFGADFLVLAPEHELVQLITESAQRSAIDEYLAYVKTRSERERMSEVKQVTGCFTGAYALHPFTGRKLPVWIAEYVLAGYGTGAIMAVPCGDQRDFEFAQHMNIPVTNIIGDAYTGQSANPSKDAILQNSDFLNGLQMQDAISVAIQALEEKGIGTRKVNYRMRDAGFSRQRYWGEPFPIIWQDGIAHALSEKDLPLQLPHADQYGPGPEGEGPLANMTDWVNLQHAVDGITVQGKRETATMPGYAGSSWYFLRYMDPGNQDVFCDRSISDYWNQVDVYVGGTEHAVGHLLYSRMWTKFLYDRGWIGFDEPYRKLVNQGMIQGSSRFVYRVVNNSPSSDFNLPLTVYVSEKYYKEYLKNGFISELKLRDLLNGRMDTGWPEVENDNNKAVISINPIHVDVKFVDGYELDIESYKSSKPELTGAIFILEDNKYICGSEVEKMSKSKYNTVNPDDLVEQYGADTFRMYEMFLGPIEASKPWDTKGIEGVHRFLRKCWRLFFDEKTGPVWTDEKPTATEYKALHKTIRKIEEDTERFSFNTAVSAFMMCVNELTELGCHKKEILQDFLILLAPYAPHMTEELWHQMGCAGSILQASFPAWNPDYLTETSKDYPVSVNGKLRTNLLLPLDIDESEMEKAVLNHEVVQKWLEGRAPKKIIFVKNKMINVVV